MSKALAGKLAEVMASVDRIPKNGRNTFHNYDYATEADIVSAIRLELAQRSVVLLPAVTGSTREPVGEKGQVLTHLSMEFTFFDGESGESITRPWLGAGTDKEDKGAYKAMTGGEKYFLLKTFLIPTGDDPEAEGAEKPSQTRQAPRSAAPATPATQRRVPEVPPRQAQQAASTVGLRVVNAKVASEGVNDKGPWKLYAVKFSDGKEATTFSKSLYQAADEACRDGLEVEPQLAAGKGGKHNLIGLMPVFRQESA
jgi:hypothetical protein